MACALAMKDRFQCGDGFERNVAFFQSGKVFARTLLRHVRQIRDPVYTPVGGGEAPHRPRKKRTTGSVDPADW